MPRGRRGWTLRRRESVAGMLFVLPDLVGLAIFAGLPMAVSIVLGLLSVSGFGGYRFAIIWQVLLVDKVGIVDRLLSLVGLSGASWLGNPAIALDTVVVVSVWFLMGFYMLIFLGGLQDIPREYYEAAEMDGAGRLDALRFITLPLLTPTSLFVVLVSIVAAVAGGQAFDLIYVMTKGGPDNSTALAIYYIYQQAFQFNEFGYASAMATTLVVLLMALTLVLFALTRGGRFEHE